MATLVGALVVLLAVWTPAAGAVGGPVILGGDDLQDHGEVDSSGNSEDGWLYIERAIANIKPRVGRANDNSISAFGSADPGVVDDSSDGDAGAAIKNAAAKNGMSVKFLDGGPAMTEEFQRIANGTSRPAIIWFAGTGAENDLGNCQSEEAQALTANASTINAFVNEGGGLMSHGVCYGWINALIPGLTTHTDNAGGTGDLYLTPDGQSAFPGVTDADVGAGPWHNRFEGDLGGLQILARSKTRDDSTGQDSIVVIGGGQVSFTEKPTDLGITKVDSADPSRAGSDLTYTLTVTNHGPNPATGVSVTDTPPSGLSARSATASQGSCSGTGPVTCSLGDLASGASATVTIVVRPTEPGTITNTATVAGNQPDPNSANNSASQQTTISARPAARRRVDRRAPVVAVGGVRASGCLRSGFRASVTIRDSSALRRVVVKVDGRTVRRTKSKRFRVAVPARGMRAGRHTIRVLAVDARGNRRVATRSFRRCAAPVVLPVFTG